MCILYSNYYITFIILSILFFKYHALENNVENFDSTSLDLIQNDLLSKNFIDQDSLVHSISGICDNKYLRKRQTVEQRGQYKQKRAIKTKSKTKAPPKKPTLQKPQTPASKPKLSTPKTSIPRSTTRKPQKGKPSNVRTTTRRTTPKVTRPNITTKKQTTSKTTTTKKSSSKRPTTKQTTPKTTTTKKPSSQTPTTKRTKPIRKSTRKSSSKPSTIITTSESTTTPKPDKYAREKSKLITLINALRRHYYSKELDVSFTLTSRAQKLADILSKHHNWTMNANESSYGVVLYYTESREKYNAFHFWSRGIEKIRYEDLENTVPPDFGQLVWASSKEIGCGISEGKPDSDILTVCLIYPKGNIPGQYSKNIRNELNKV
uniref:SCP domain-containing protein n=1 Tax=Strongyloides papillosus TaxID=174720 RepID=A0A0N5BL48_STREA